MLVVIAIVGAIALSSFLIGWGMKSDINNSLGVSNGKTSDADRLIWEMRRVRAEEFAGNEPVVRELKREFASKHEWPK
jgi:hypothetical protein